MGSATPPLTVGMPVYNGARYVADAIESILRQTYSDFEFIISDNASTDNTEEICRSYAAIDRRIVYSRLAENRGAAPNFNRVFLKNRSPFFKFAAADDVCAPHFLERCKTAYQHAPEDTVLCFPTTIKIDSEGRQQGILEESMDLRQPEPHARFRVFLLNYFYSNCFYGLLRAASYRSTRLHKSYHSADVVLLAELALRGQFWQLDEPLLMRRFHEEMSHEANPTPAKIRSWYDPSKRGTLAFPRIRMFWEFLGAIGTTPMSTTERIRCGKELVTVWIPKNWKRMAWDVVRNAGISIPRRS